MRSPFSVLKGIDFAQIEMSKLIKMLAPAMLVTASFMAHATDNEECKVVRFADIGWADITATNALAGKVLKGLGYKPKGPAVMQKVLG